MITFNKNKHEISLLRIPSLMCIIISDEVDNINLLKVLL